jgi:hypothetical protein
MSGGKEPLASSSPTGEVAMSVSDESAATNAESLMSSPEDGTAASSGESSGAGAGAAQADGGHHGGAEPLMSMAQMSMVSSAVPSGSSAASSPSGDAHATVGVEAKPKSAARQQAGGDHAAGALGVIEDHGTTRTEEILRPDEIFRGVGKNTVAKKVAFNKLNAAIKERREAQTKLDRAQSPKAREAAEKALAVAKANVEDATEHLKEFIVDAKLAEDKKVLGLRKEIASARKAKDHARAMAIEAELHRVEASLRPQYRAEVDAMKHAAHPDISVFEPEATDVSRHDFVFPDGEHVRLRDHVVAYATTAALGVDSDTEQTKAEKKQGHADVQKVMENSGLSGSKVKILKAISGFEGTFDTVNTYDKAKVTWGFVQWTGGHASDLTKALSVIKESYPDAFAKQFQAYGIDVEKDELVIRMPDGTGCVRGDEAAQAIMRNPRLAAAMAHAGRDKDIQKGQVRAASLTPMCILGQAPARRWPNVRSTRSARIILTKAPTTLGWRRPKRLS